MGNLFLDTPKERILIWKIAMKLTYKVFKLNILILSLLLCIFGFSVDLFAHPLDVTVSAIYVKDKVLTVEMNWHPFEVKHLLSKYDKTGSTWKKFKENEALYYKYIKKNFIVYNNGELCKFVPIGMPEIDDASMYSEGVVFLFDVKSSMEMDKVKIINTLFINDFRLQTNKIVFLTEDIDVNDINEIVLTSKVTETEQWLITKRDEASAPDNTDSDGDLMPDRLEPLYGCDPDVWDTDGDGYSDGDEIINGWDPTDPNPGPGQPVRNSLTAEANEDIEVDEDDYLFEPDEENQSSIEENISKSNDETNEYESLSVVTEEKTTQDNPSSVSESKSTGAKDIVIPQTEEDKNNEDVFSIMENVDSEGNVHNDNEGNTLKENPIEQEFDFDDDLANKRYEELKRGGKTPSRTRLSKLMNKALSFVDERIDDPNIFIRLLIFFPILLLGFLHAFESGHGKTILASYLIHTRRNFFDALIFSVITAFAHIGTVTLIGFLSIRLIETMGNTYNIVIYMPIIASIIMLIIGIFIIREGIINLKGSSKDIEEKYKKRGLGNRMGFLLSGFLIGIVPCPIGLGIVSWILAHNKHGWLLPMMLIYGLGILISLLLVASVILITKRTSFNKFRKLSKVAPLVSGIFMIISAIVIIITGTAF